MKTCRPLERGWAFEVGETRWVIIGVPGQRVLVGIRRVEIRGIGCRRTVADHQSRDHGSGGSVVSLASGGFNLYPVGVGGVVPADFFFVLVAAGTEPLPVLPGGRSAVRIPGGVIKFLDRVVAERGAANIIARGDQGFEPGVKDRPEDSMPIRPPWPGSIKKRRMKAFASGFFSHFRAVSAGRGPCPEIQAGESP